MQAFAPAPKKPISPWFLAAMATLAAMSLCWQFLLADDADARVRAANAKVVFEAADQAVVPDAPPAVDLRIRKIAGSVAPFKPLDASCRIKVDGNNACYGSGTVIEQGVLTCAHLFTDGDKTTEITAECGGEIATAKIDMIDHAADLAILSVEWKTPKPAARLATKVPSQGDPLTTCGRDVTGRLDCTDHKTVNISAYEHSVDILYMPPPFLGRSGGGVFNAADELVGVVHGYEVSTKVGYATSFIEVEKLLKRPKARVPRILFFHAEWCVPCQVAIRDFPEWLKASGYQVDPTERAHVQLVDFNKHPDLARTYGVSLLPTMVLIDSVDGEIKASDPVQYAGRQSILDLFGKVK